MEQVRLFPLDRSVAVSTASVKVLEANIRRRTCVFCNNGATVIYLSFVAPATITSGIRLNADGGAYLMDLMNLWTGEVFVISSAVSGALLIHEVSVS